MFLLIEVIEPSGNVAVAPAPSNPVSYQYWLPCGIFYRRFAESLHFGGKSAQFRAQDRSELKIQQTRNEIQCAGLRRVIISPHAVLLVARTHINNIKAPQVARIIEFRSLMWF